MQTVREMPEDDRPREKLVKRGAEALSDSELVAILLRTGRRGVPVVETAREALTRFGSLSAMAGKSVEALTTLDGVGKDKAATLIAAFELGRRVASRSRWNDDRPLRKSSEVAEYLTPLLRDETQERFVVVCLSGTNRVLAHKTIFVGTVDASVAAPREIYKFAVEQNAKSVIFAHNHPSGDPTPSAADVEATRRLIEAGKTLDIRALDHIVIGDGSYVSMADTRRLTFS